ncbi:MAG TPA: hypothetical protein VJQ56_15620 [Blastocatellia bacterium]|nr:hypothetical protein [Blastocatellia bacterium]
MIHVSCKKSVLRLFTALAILAGLAQGSGAAGQRSISKPVSPASKNSWRGITPLKSSAEDVGRVLGIEAGSAAGMVSGPFQVEGGEVTFSYLTESLAKIYRAPRSLVGKVFTIYFTPTRPVPVSDLKPAGFKRCSEEMDKGYYYLVSDAGLVYQLLRKSEEVETIIYQPTQAEVRRLAVGASCAF